LNAAEDKKRKDAVETRNQLDTTIYQLEKALKETGEKLPAEKKTKVETALADAKKDLEANDPDRMKAALENLTKVGGEFYADAQAAAQAAPGAAGAPPAEGPGASPEPDGQKAEKKADVVDADFEVVDDEKAKK
jgi:molecular chaperone DnaK